MSLPVPNLDDRRFQDLVDEAKRMIPSLVPEWTNHNVADPGVALIELFAWMSEQVIYRLNQVPEKLYVDFLNLLGTSPFPAAAARTPLTFWLSGVPDETVVIPAGTEVTTERGGIVFATLDELRVVQPTLEGALTSAGESTYVDVLPELRYDRDTVACFPSTPVAAGDALNLGFDVSLAGQMVDLNVTTASRGVGVDPQRAPIVWEVWSSEHWIAADVLEDTTGGLNRSGTVRLVVPPAHDSLVLNGQRCHWLRVRLLEARDGQPTFHTSPRIADVRVSTRGGSVMAEHARAVDGEGLGTSDGTPAQRFRLANHPVLPREPGEHVVVTVQGDSSVYEEVADFSASTEADRHVRFDDALGIVEFGPRVRYPDGTSVQHGAVPPFGAQIAMTRYRTGGGLRGNVDARTLTYLRSSIPFVDQVANLEPARGGVDAETVDEVKVRGPRTLRAGHRAVTPSDYEQLTLESTPKVARAKCVPASSPAEPVAVLVVPSTDRDPESCKLDDFALTPELFTAVREHLDARRTLGALLRITAPFYQGVSVVAQVRAIPGRSPVAVKERVTRTIARYLSPLLGGPHGTGWPFGDDLSAASLTSLVEALPGVAGVDNVALFEYDLRNEQRLGDSLDMIHLEPGALFLAGRTQVVVR